VYTSKTILEDNMILMK